LGAEQAQACTDILKHNAARDGYLSPKLIRSASAILVAGRIVCETDRKAATGDPYVFDL
jgi:hypothetical protein